MNGETKTNLKIKQTRKRRKAKPERCEKGKTNPLPHPPFSGWALRAI